MCLRRAPEKYIAGAALDRAALELQPTEKIALICGNTISTKGNNSSQDDRVHLHSRASDSISVGGGGSSSSNLNLGCLHPVACVRSR
jgi:hypothetical protein